MAKYEAFPAFSAEGKYAGSSRIPESLLVPWAVVMRNGSGQVEFMAKTMATFHGPAAEKDAKCHAAKLNERESGPEVAREVSEAIQKTDETIANIRNSLKA